MVGVDILNDLIIFNIRISKIIKLLGNFNETVQLSKIFSQLITTPIIKLIIFNSNYH